MEGDVAGYHFYPTRDRVRGWIASADMAITEERYERAEDDWGYRHLYLGACAPTARD